MPDIACGAMQRRLDNAEQAEAEWKAAAERATALADRLADAIEQISAALAPSFSLLMGRKWRRRELNPRNVPTGRA
jgi:predicted NBD/HSP70 family sugar kinase